MIIIDSWNKLHESSLEFDSLRTDFPNTIWVVIFQRTSGGVIRGGNAPLFDAGINIEIVKSEEGFEKKYAICNENSYPNTGSMYLIFEGKII